MILSKSCEYAIKSTVYIGFCSSEGRKIGIAEIADTIDSPIHFTGKILQELSRKGVIRSAKGPTGGFFIDLNESLNIIDIIHAIDGDDLFNSCVLGLKTCSAARPCPMHFEMKPIREQLRIEFSMKSVQDLVEEYKQNKYVLK